MGTPANNYGSLHTFLAGGAITANTTVKLSAAGTVVITTAITEDVIGIATKTVASGEYVEVFCLNGGKHNVTSGGAITAGDQVIPGANGKCLTAVSAGATAKSFGIALSASGGDGQAVEVLLRFGTNGILNS